MVDYEKMYILMFRASERAVRQMEKNDIPAALRTIKEAQLACETIYIEAPEEECRERS